MISTLVVLALLGADDMQVLEAEGFGALSLGRIPATQMAKDAALRQIILKACKQVAGADPSIAQCAIADDRLFAGFSGMVQSLEVVKEEVTADTVKVTMRGAISMKAVSSEEVEAQRLYQRLGSIKLSVGMQGVIAMRLTEFFKAEGWKMFGIGPTDGEDIEAVQAAAKPDATDYALCGSTKVEQLEPEPGDWDRDHKRLTTYRVRASGLVRLIDLAAGKKVAEVTFDRKSVGGAGADVQGAKLVGEETPRLGTELRAGMVKALREAEAKGTVIVLTITGIKNAPQADDLKGRIAKASGVTAVAGDLVDQALKLEVRCSMPAKELARTLAKAMGARLSVTGVRVAAIDATAK